MKQRPSISSRTNAAQHPLRGILGALVLVWGVLAVQPPASAQVTAPTIFVNSTSDTGDQTINGVCDTGNLNSEGATECTLRAAIQEANDNIDISPIEFNIPASDPGFSGAVWVLAPATKFLKIDRQALIDATTQPTWVDVGSHPPPKVVIDGSALINVGDEGLFVSGGGNGSLISGLSLVGFPGGAIQADEDDVVISDNYIGLWPDLTPDGNGGSGVLVRRVNVLIDRNVIAANVSDGINLNSNVSGAQITRNLIGVDPNGVPAGNGNGIWTDGSGPIAIGGINPADSNVIANNTNRGVEVDKNNEVSIVGNSIYNHGIAGISLGATPNINDPGDSDGGPNDMLNYPVLSDSGVTNQVDFQFDGAAASYRIDFFTLPSGPNPSLRGEGETFVGFANITHPGGVADYSFTDAALTPGSWVSATNTLITGTPSQTSEFAFSIQLPGVRQFEVNSTGDADLDPANGGLCTTGNILPDSSQECTLRAALSLANEASSRDEVSFNIPTADAGHSGGVWTIQPGLALPGSNESIVVDGSTQPGFVATPVIELDGQGAANAGLLLFGDDSLVQSLAIGGFTDGIRINTGDRTQILGNHVGLDAGGTQARPNSDDGIDVTSGTTGVEVGGPGAGEGNLVANSADDGISVCCGGVAGLLVRGNVIGTDVTQTLDMANLDDGIAITGASVVTVGGASAGSGNTLVNSLGSAISVLGPGSDVDVQGNLIGLTSGGSAMGNGAGVTVSGSVTEVQVGGLSAGSANTIANNTAAAVSVSSTSQSVFVNTNIIHSNGFGIELNPDSPNDPGDIDTGANDQLNRAVLSSLFNGATTFEFIADLDVPASNYRLELFDNLPGETQGRSFLGAVDLDTTGGTTLFARTVPGNVSGVLTASLTPCDAACTTLSIGTSPFSAPVTPAGLTVVINSTSDAEDDNIGDGQCDTGALNSEGNIECTLRAAISELNSGSPLDTVNFNIPVTDGGHNAGTWTFQPASGYADIVATVSLDARTQPGYVDVPVIELDGSLAVGATAGLRVTGTGAAVRGFMVHSFPDDGLEIAGDVDPGDNNSFTDNWVGIDRNLNPAPNGDVGFLITTSSANNNIERNVIVASTSAAIELRFPGSDDNRIVNNWIGELPDGTPMPNSAQGLWIHDQALRTVVGEIGLGNVISNNAAGGIFVQANAGSGTVITDNRVEDNTGTGVEIAAADGIILAGNTIQRNSGYGVSSPDAVTAAIGGTGAGDGNTISGNGLDAISVSGATAGLEIVGNTIGISDLGAPLGNQNGINVVGTVTSLRIGDELSETGNTIAFNTASGIRIGEFTQNVFIAANEIHSNGFGIELSPDTPNDPGDGDTGANHQLNRPLLSQVSNGATDFNYTVTLDVPIGEYRIDLFDNTLGEDQGRTYLGSNTLDKTSGLPTVFMQTEPGQVTGALTATLTPCDAGCVSPQLGSSPFSAPIALSTSTAFVNSTSNNPDNNIGDDLCDTGFLNSDGDAECTLAAAVSEANASAIVNTVNFDIPATDPGHTSGVWRISPTGAIEAVTETAVIDARTQTGYAGAPVIEVDGASSVTTDGLRLESPAVFSELYGFAVINYGDAGIWSRADDSIIAFNYAGVEADGITPAPNVRGIDVWDGVSRVEISSNVASGNSGSGIGVFDIGTSGITIDGNFVGTDPTGLIPVPNGGSGVAISNASSVQIGTLQPNVISGNGGNGIQNSSSDSTVIVNNIIGLNASGSAPIPNGGDGVFVDGTSGFVNVGTSGNGNYIGGNVGNGIVISAADNTNTIRNNYIGTDVARTLDLGNGVNGVLIRPGAQFVAVTNNVIANNGLDGIRADAGVTSNVGAIQNETFNNARLGIDLGADGVTLNDPGDIDTGANGLLNYPVVQAINPSGANFTIDYMLDVPAGNYVATFYTNPSGADPSGFGESENFLVNDVVFSHPGGVAVYTTVAVALSGGSAITGGVYVNGTGNAASEYGPVFSFTGISVVNSSGDLPDSNVGDGVCSTGATVSTSDPECTLRAAIQEANSVVGGETIYFNILPADGLYDSSGNGEFTIQPGTPLPAITKSVSIDGSTQPGYVAQPLIELDGSLSSCPTATCSGLRLQGGTVSVNALAINNWGVDGIELDADPTSVITNSFIGTDVTGTVAKPNILAGVRASSGAVGGADLQGNTIAFNGGPGVAVVASTETVTVSHNSIHSNAGLGIDLNDDGKTQNDSGDGDSGPNDLLNTPAITSVADAGSGQIRIDALVDVPAGDYMVQIFKNPLGGNANGDVQAQTLEASVPIISAGSGNQPHNFVVPGTVGDRITLTLTQDVSLVGLKATSEISQAVTAVPAQTAGVRDASLNRNDGTFGTGVSTADTVTGVIGDAISFDNVNDSVLLPILHSRSTEVTVSAWINPSSVTDSVVLSSGGPLGDQISLGTLTSVPDGLATATIVVNGTPVTATGGTITAGNWYHLAATWDSSTLELFLDGVSVATSPAAPSLPADSDSIGRIGGSSGTSSFVGLIDEVRVMPISADPQWILADYEFGAGTNQSGTFGAQETGAALPWAQVGSGGRSGSGAASAPTASPEQSWLVANGVDEVGVEFESWWFLTTDTGIDVGQGTRTASLGGAQNEVRVSSAAGFEISEYGPGGSNQLQAPTGGAYGSGWRRVRIRIDQNGASIVAIDGVDLSGPVLFDSDPASGSVGFRSVALPNGEQWLIDDVLARRYVNPEPTSTVYNYERR